MDLPKKSSRRYFTGVYAFFIMLFAITVSLFYVSRCQDSPRPAKQNADIPEAQDSSGNLLKVTKKLDSDKGESEIEFEAPDSEKDVNDEKNKAPLPKNDASGEQKLNIDDFKASSGEVIKPSAELIRPQISLNPDSQKTEIYFSTESTGLTDKALDKLRKIFLFLSSHPDEELIIEGYGDSNSTGRLNSTLSKLRVNIVKGYFVKRGISDSRIKAFWIGAENPEKINHSQEDKNKTHQVEIEMRSN